MKQRKLIVHGSLLIAGETGESCYRDGWVAIENDRILALGEGESFPLQWPEESLVIDAGGKTVLPGLIDNHFHVVSTALHDFRLDFSQARSFEDVGCVIQSAHKNADQTMILGIGLDDTKLQEKRYPDRTILDRYCSNVPLAIYSQDFHVLMLNTYAVLYFKTPFTMNGVELDSLNVPTGIFSKQAGAKLDRQIIQSSTEQERMLAVERLMPKLLSRGVTSIAAMEGDNIKNNLGEDVACEFLFAHKTEFPVSMDLFYQTVDIPRILSKNLRRIGGALYLDGTLGSRTAALRFDYADAPEKCGMLFFSQEDLNHFVERCCQHALQVSFDAIGDAAIEMALLAFEQAAAHYDVKSMRHRIEHAELIDDGQIARAVSLGIVLSMQPAYEGHWGEIGGMYQQRLGDHYGQSNQFRSIIDAGLILCGGSDSDVTDYNPMQGIHYAVNHPVARNRVTLPEALRMYTYNGAFALFKEREIGSLAPGKKADIVILDRDILKTDPTALNDVGVEMTIKAGDILFNRREYA